MRIGIGYDVHPLVEGRPLILGGVTITHHLGLAGHSDADVLVHAIMDALLGAMGEGDIGRRFPDNDPRFEGISSLLLLQQVALMMEERGWQLQYLDTIIIAQRPRLALYMEAMRANIARALNTEQSRVHVKATTTEGLGALGREEGIAGQAAALLAPLPPV